MNKMNPEIKARWVAALRSGEYKQAREALRNRDGHCCLGVLCDLFAKEAGEPWSKRKLSELDGQVLGGYSFKDPAMPSARVAIWSSCDWSKRVRIKGRWDTLYEHNDSGRTFSEIADAIEAQL